MYFFYFRRKSEESFIKQKLYSGEFIEKTTATFIKGGDIKSPMGGNTQAYKDKAAAEKAATELQATLTP